MTRETKKSSGSPKILAPFKKWRWIWRGRFEIAYASHQYVLDVNYVDFDEKLHVYKDGFLLESKKSPARIEVGNKTFIEAELSTYGMKYVRLRTPELKTIPLQPSTGTAEAWRARLNTERPKLSKAIGIFSWTVLVIAALTQIPELLSLIASLTDANLPNFALPGWLNVTLTIAGVIAALDRALQLKYHSMIDE